MNWEAINAIAQLIGSLGVVASFWYLAVQVHRSTRITKLSAQDAATTALREVTRPFAENPEVGRIAVTNFLRRVSRPVAVAILKNRSHEWRSSELQSAQTQREH